MSKVTGPAPLAPPGGARPSLGSRVSSPATPRPMTGRRSCSPEGENGRKGAEAAYRTALEKRSCSAAPDNPLRPPRWQELPRLVRCLRPEAPRPWPHFRGPAAGQWTRGVREVGPGAAPARRCASKLAFPAGTTADEGSARARPPLSPWKGVEDKIPTVPPAGAARGGCRGGRPPAWRSCRANAPVTCPECRQTGPAPTSSTINLRQAHRNPPVPRRNATPAGENHRGSLAGAVCGPEPRTPTPGRSWSSWPATSTGARRESLPRGHRSARPLRGPSRPTSATGDDHGRFAQNRGDQRLQNPAWSCCWAAKPGSPAGPAPPRAGAGRPGWPAPLRRHRGWWPYGRCLMDNAPWPRGASTWPRPAAPPSAPRGPHRTGGQGSARRLHRRPGQGPFGWERPRPV